MDWTPVLAWLSSHSVRILIVLVVFGLLVFLVRRAIPHAVRGTVARRMEGKHEEEIEKRVKTLSSVLIDLVWGIAIIAVVMIILSEVGINIAPLLAGLGIVGIAVGFGAQSLIRDIVAGLFILLENQYCVGDWVQIASIGGSVEEISLRRTVLRDLDGTVHVIPNGEIKVASNFTREWARVNMNISVAYDTNLDHAIAVINSVGKEMAQETYWRELILKAPEALRVDKLGDSGIEIRILGDTKPMRQWEVMGELRKRIKKTFDEAGIEIPWPHTKVYFGSLPPADFTAVAPPSPPQEFRPPYEEVLPPPSEEEGSE